MRLEAMRIAEDLHRHNMLTITRTMEEEHERKMQAKESLYMAAWTAKFRQEIAVEKAEHEKHLSDMSTQYLDALSKPLSKVPRLSQNYPSQLPSSEYLVRSYLGRPHMQSCTSTSGSSTSTWL
jgi:hypothetical protein